MLNARAQVYALLARLYLGEIDAELAAELAALPGFDALLASSPPTTHHPLLTSLAVEYQRLFGLEVYPYESLFVDDDLMLNTAATDRVVALYEDCGFEVGAARVGAADHLGLELRLMGELAQAEAEAAGDAARRAWARRMQARCLDEHLAAWAPLCALTLARVAREPVYQLVAALTAELVTADVAEYGAQREEGGDPSAVTLHASRSALDDEPGIGALVRELLTPARVGLWLCRSDIRAVGQALGLPAPIGERVAMLRGLFQAAGEYEQVPALLAALDAVWTAMGESVAALVAQSPGWSGYASPWQARLAYGRTRLAALRREAEGAE